MHMNWISILFFLFLIPLKLTEKLTISENKLRKETCGEGLKLKKGYGRKILNGVKSKITDAPWNVAIEVMNEKESGLCTGTLISSRHVITARHCFAILKDDGYVWTTNETKIRGCEKDTEKDLVVNGDFSKMFKLYAGTDCGYRQRCHESRVYSSEISKIFLPKVCDDKQLDFDDFAILELSKNLEFSSSIRPICTAEKGIDLFNPDVRMRLYGFGLDVSSANDSIGRLKYETGDSGGGVVRIIDDRVTVVGIIYQGITCEVSTRNELDYIASVAFYTDDICRYTGICSLEVEKIDDSTSATSGTSGKIYFSFLLIFSFCHYIRINEN
ncbi:hypothetical protein B9Z55_028369 [Caenorhabditis nigoni]|nr:hypothetical protein B9Z55_028369 [Caenorhabditis nigoni]